MSDLTAGGQARSDSPDNAARAIITFFSHASPLLLLTLTLSSMAWRASLGPFHPTELIAPTLIVAGWPFLEWSIHVWMLHYRPVTLFGRRIDFRLPQTHRDHHAAPWDLQRVFIPLHIFVLVPPLLLLGAWLILPTPEWAATTLLFYFGLGLHYEWVHYLAHIRWCPDNRYYQRRVRHHRLHHFRNEKLWWGVSMGLGDRLLGTAPPSDSVNRSGSTGNLLER